MPEFRQDFITKEWVIIAPERAKRPDQFARKADGRAKLPAHDPECPFCTGNESMTPPAIFTSDENGSWALRVVPNKFAAVNPELSPSRTNSGQFLAAGGFGIAEVIIETPAHNLSPALLTKDQVAGILKAYKNRYAALAHDPKVDLVTIFRNHGAAAGTSLVHPHSQVIATPIVPPRVRQLMQQSLIYHDTYGLCPYCVMIDEEVSQGKRIVEETDLFVAFCPYASHVPFEIRILPKRHYSRFSEISMEEINELADLLRSILRKLYVGLGDPDYNFVIHTSPTSDGELHYDHWRLLIVPRLTTPAGFEMGSGIYIDIMPPEQSAEFLRSVNID